MNVRTLIKKLKKMPQDLEVGHASHDYDEGDSDSIVDVRLLTDEDANNDTGKVDRYVVIGS